MFSRAPFWLIPPARIWPGTYGGLCHFWRPCCWAISRWRLEPLHPRQPQQRGSQGMRGMQDQRHIFQECCRKRASSCGFWSQVATCLFSSYSATFQRWGGKVSSHHPAPKGSQSRGPPSRPYPKPARFLRWFQKASPSPRRRKSLTPLYLDQRAKFLAVGRVMQRHPEKTVCPHHPGQSPPWFSVLQLHLEVLSICERGTSYLHFALDSWS